MVRLKYDGLGEGRVTWIYQHDDRNRGLAVERVPHNGVVEVADLDDPDSPRAEIARGHIDRGMAHVVEEQEKP